MKQSKFYNQTVNSYKNRILSLINEKLNNLAPSRSYSFSHSVAQEALVALDNLNTQHGIEIFLIAGALLGLVREGKLLSHDYDLDMGFFLDKLSVEKLEKIIHYSKDFTIESTRDNTVVIDFKGLKIDLFGFEQIDENTLRLSTTVHYWNQQKFDLEKVPFIGTEVFIPKNPEIYLKGNYGDWKNKKLVYDFSYDTPNRGYNGLAGLIYLLARLENAIRKGWDSYASLAIAALYKNYQLDYRHLFPVPVVKHPADNLKPHSKTVVIHPKKFDTQLIKSLKEKVEKDKNFIIGLIEDERTTDYIELIGNLSFVTQVIVYNKENANLLHALYKENEIIFDDPTQKCLSTKRTYNE